MMDTTTRFALTATNSGKLAEALDRLRASVAIDGRDADAWSNLGLVLQAIGHRRAAVEVFE